MTPDQIPADVVKAAHTHDHNTRSRGGSWSRVPDDQLLRLLESLHAQGWIYISDPAVDAVLRPGYRRRVADAIEQHTRTDVPTLDELVDAFLAVRDREMENVRDGCTELAAQAEQRAKEAEAAIARVRRLCALTINASVRTDAIQQARDTLAVLDRGE